MDFNVQENFNETVDTFIQIFASYGLDVFGAIAILIAGLFVAKWAHRAPFRALGRVNRFDQTLRGFFAKLVKYAVIIFTLLAVLNQFGVQTASLIALLGAAGLAIGLALQGTLSNVAAGVMLLIFRPYKFGDFVEVGGQSGKVHELSLFVTELNTGDNIRIFVPNSQIWGNAIKNVNFNDTRRVDLLIGISYEDDIGRAVAAIQAVIDAEPRIRTEPESLIAVSELADSSVNLVVRAWCETVDYWSVRFGLIRSIKERLDAENITIPYPQRQIHMSND